MKRGLRFLAVAAGMTHAQEIKRQKKQDRKVTGPVIKSSNGMD